MSLLHKVRRFEADLTRAVEQKARAWSKSGAREPLEVAQAIVDAVAERLEPAARGRYVFPYNRLHVSIVAASKDERARFAAVLESEPSLRDRVNLRLREAGCDPGRLQIVVAYVPRPSPTWRSLEPGSQSGAARRPGGAAARTSVTSTAKRGGIPCDATESACPVSRG